MCCAKGNYKDPHGKNGLVVAPAAAASSGNSGRNAVYIPAWKGRTVGDELEEEKVTTQLCKSPSFAHTVNLAVWSVVEVRNDQNMFHAEGG